MYCVLEPKTHVGQCRVQCMRADDCSAGARCEVLDVLTEDGTSAGQWVKACSVVVAAP